MLYGSSVIHALDGPVLPYAWGSRSALSELLGRVPSGLPEAELWVGAHPGGPARLVTPAGTVSTLPELLATDLTGLLGPELAARFGRLPFLLKVLAIAEPLSLQAHPDAEQARAGFAREEALGLARSHPKRNYKDEHHKPELILALSPVDALCGFRPHGEAHRLLREFGLVERQSALVSAVSRFTEAEGALESLFRSFFALSSGERDSIVGRVLARARDLAAAPGGDEELEWVAKWLLRLDRTYGADAGLLATLLLQPLRLEPGQAAFLPARRLHAYLSGVGIEVMADSDNVLRGGLTPKHVDVQELCNVLDFEPSQPELVVPEVVGNGRARTFRTAAEEFELWWIEPAAGEPIAVPTPCVFIVVAGEVEFVQGGRRVSFGHGAQGFAAASPEALHVSGSGSVALAAARASRAASRA